MTKPRFGFLCKIKVSAPYKLFWGLNETIYIQYRTKCRHTHKVVCNFIKSLESVDFELGIVCFRRDGLSCLTFSPWRLHIKEKISLSKEVVLSTPYYRWNMWQGGVLSLGWTLRTFIGKPSQKTLHAPPYASLCVRSLITTQHYICINSFPSILLSTWPQVITPFSELFDYTFKFTSELDMQRNQCTPPDSPKNVSDRYYFSHARCENQNP